MKVQKKFFKLSLVALSISLLTGCMTQKPIVGTTKGESTPPAPSVAAPAQASGAPNSNVNITESEAKKIALDKEGFAEAAVVFLRSDLDRDDGKMIYEVEFHKGTTEYNYEIDGISGDILSYDYDIETTVAPTTDGKTDYISEDAAKEKALSHAGLKASDVTFTGTKLDRDDGKMTYEIEFHKGTTEYDYEIDAVSGDVLKYDTDIR